MRRIALYLGFRPERVGHTYLAAFVLAVLGLWTGAWTWQALAILLFWIGVALDDFSDYNVFKAEQEIFSLEESYERS